MTQENFLENFGRAHNLWMYACSRCGECVSECPVYEETGDDYTAPGFKIKKMRPIVNKRILPFLSGLNEEEVKKLVKGLYECTLCGRCVSVCPYNYDLVDLWETARESAIESGLGLDSINDMINATVEEKNYFKRPHARRTEWARRFKIETKEKANTVYFVGCVTSYTPTMRPVGGAVSTILDAAGEDWTMLNDEWCCGVPQKFGGGIKTLREFAAHNVEAIESAGAERVVFNCPGCYRMFKHEYPKVLGHELNFSLVHLTELVNEYVESGKIKLTGKMDQRLTWHDPCELSRLLGIVDEPRNVLKNVATDFVELPEAKFNSHCCGGGGLYKAVDTKKSINIANRRVEQAENAGAATLASGCPSCMMNLSQAALFKKSNVKVLDFAQVVAQLIK
jgi:Fe-S oxidoreductase